MHSDLCLDLLVSDDEFQHQDSLKVKRKGGEYSEPNFDSMMLDKRDSDDEP